MTSIWDLYEFSVQQHDDDDWTPDPDEIAGYEEYLRERAQYIAQQIHKGFVWGRAGFRADDNEHFSINCQADYDAAGAFLEGYVPGLKEYIAMKNEVNA